MKINLGEVEINKLEFIDALRGIAAITVVAFHLVYIPQPNLAVPLLLDKFFKIGGSGVTLFFVISAFTLYLSMENRKDEKNKIAKFYLRRLFRIAPLFYVMLFFHVITSMIIFNSRPSWKIILLNITFTYNFAPWHVESIVWAGWTIGVEMIFYLLMPLIFIKVNSLNKSIIFTICTIFIADIYNSFLKQALIIHPDVIDKYLNMNFVYNLPVFAIGIITYFIYRDCIPKINFINRAELSHLLLFIFIILILAITNNQVNFIMPILYWKALSYSLLVISLSLSVNKLLVSPILKFYGKISYSMYLVHPLLIYFLTPLYRYIYSNIHLPIIVDLSLCIILTVIFLTPVSLTTYYLIEEPGIKYGKRLIMKI